MTSISDIISLFAVGVLWGGTNPLIRRGSQGVEKVHADSKVWQFLLELKFLVTTWQYILPFALNQSGSLLYFLTLQNTDLSLAVPLANSLSFVFTAIVALLLGEQKASKKSYVGMALIIMGTLICSIDKIQ